MERHPPRATNDAIDLYLRTYYSLLRSSGDVHVRAFEEAHAFSDSSLHLGAREQWIDVAAFAYSAARLPSCVATVGRIVLGQSHEHFTAAGLDVRHWDVVHTRGRRRPSRWNGGDSLAVYITSTSDIDDLVPIVTAYQIEWNKLHGRLSGTALGKRLAEDDADTPLSDADVADLGRELGLEDGQAEKLREAFGESWPSGLRAVARRESDLVIRLLNGSYSQYQRAAHRWWSGIEPVYLREAAPRRRPVYFVSSNTHSLINLLGGYARTHRDEMLAWARERNPENLAPVLRDAIAAGDELTVSNLLYYLLRTFLRESNAESRERVQTVQRADALAGITTVESPGKIDVSAQLIELSRLRPETLDLRILVPGIERLAESDAVVVNIDYPLGMAAYHHLARLAQGVGEIRGVYVMGKAATLNGRVGDVMLSNVSHDEHSRNTYLYKNCFTARDVQPFMRVGTVLDNQKALTVRSAYLQNRDYMSVFYREGYTVMEMETGPFLSALCETVLPNRHPEDQIVHLSILTPFDVGILHYASDTPYSRRQSLLSKSLSYFGVESTYACAAAIARRIFAAEVARVSGHAG
ncbi:MAG: hypothetical protein WCJ30_13280, partial [Deltaproteobacteria bacterium]